MCKTLSINIGPLLKSLKPKKIQKKLKKGVDKRGERWYNIQAVAGNPVSGREKRTAKLIEN